jgi:hypothetical protein
MCDKIENARKWLSDNKDKISVIYGKDVKYFSVGKHNQTGRMSCRMHFARTDRKHLLYSRLIYEVHIGRCLKRDETVDHIDGDPMNDVINNLQILSLSNNARKGPSKLVKDVRNKSNSDRMLSSSGDYCRGEKNNFNKLTEKEVREIREHQKTYVKGSGQDKILAEKYNVTRSAIKDIRLGNTWKHLK